MLSSTTGGCDAGLQRFTTSVGAKAPSVAGFEAGEAVFGARCGEVVAALQGEGQKVCRHASTDHVCAPVVNAGVATPVAKKTGQGVKRAGHQFVAKDVASGMWHGVMEWG